MKVCTRPAANLGTTRLFQGAREATPRRFANRLGVASLVLCAAKKAPASRGPMYYRRYYFSAELLHNRSTRIKEVTPEQVDMGIGTWLRQQPRQRVGFLRLPALDGRPSTFSRAIPRLLLLGNH